MPMKNRIKELRKSKGITQNKLCEFLSIAQPTLSGYETNTYEPDFETACKIADYFCVSVDYLLGRKESTELLDDPRVPLPQLDGVYYKMAKEAYESGITPEDAEMIIEMYRKYKK